MYLLLIYVRRYWLNFLLERVNNVRVFHLCVLWFVFGIVFGTEVTSSFTSLAKVT